MAERTYLQAISDGLRQEMRRDKRVFVIGEDVGVYGGAFGSPRASRRSSAPGG
jgi:pyruvate/2-oxoglutarate/acetoin dehydrogenase E1 component